MIWRCWCASTAIRGLCWCNVCIRKPQKGSQKNPPQFMNRVVLLGSVGIQTILGGEHPHINKLELMNLGSTFPSLKQTPIHMGISQKLLAASNIFHQLIKYHSLKINKYI